MQKEDELKGGGSKPDPPQPNEEPSAPESMAIKSEIPIVTSAPPAPIVTSGSLLISESAPSTVTTANPVTATIPVVTVPSSMTPVKELKNDQQVFKGVHFCLCDDLPDFQEVRFILFRCS